MENVAVSQFEHFIESFDKASAGYISSIQDYCSRIIFFLNSASISYNHIYFAELAGYINATDADRFFSAVTFLARSDVGYLEQLYEALDTSGNFISVETSEVLEILQSQDYSNPITGEPLTEEEFYNQVVPYFRPTSKIINERVQ